RAMRSYRAYLRRLPSASNRAEVEAKIGELQKLIEQEESAKQGPPEGTIAPSAKPPANAPPPNGAPSTAAPSTAAPSNAALRIAGAPARPAAAPKPVYQRAWFWGAVGGAIVAVALGVGLGVGLSQPSTTYPAAQTTLGTVKF
ncbi:MAG TPA: hypothetical protein VFF06_27185, partial [Polyangia bacterium]|nr:hypothetical protein [Polyangia bacterium]